MTGAERIVAAKVHWAKDFPTEKALREYLKEHPAADPAKHHVDEKAKGPGAEEDKPKAKRPPAPPKTPPKVPGKPIPKAVQPIPAKPPPVPPEAKRKPTRPEVKAPEAPTQVQAPTAPEAPQTTPPPPETKPGRFEAWKTRFKGLSQSAQNFVEAAPKAIKHFFGDDEFRKHALTEAKDAVVSAPKKLVSNLVTTAKHEVKEFKVATAGVKNVLTGKKMTKKQKAAFTDVAKHMALAGAAAGFAASGPLAAAGLFVKGLATHVALKSVRKSLGHLHMLQELGHIGEGLLHVIEHIASETDKDSMSREEAAMAQLVLACVAKEIENLTDADFQEVLNAMPDGSEKTAAERLVARYLAAA